MPITWQETDWAYLAGFVDSEGCICAYRRPQSGLYYPRMTVSQVDPTPLVWAQNELGGNIRTQRLEGRRPIHRWVISGSRLIPTLQNLLPYLKVKGDEAQLAIALFTPSIRKDRWFQSLVYRELQEVKR